MEGEKAPRFVVGWQFLLVFWKNIILQIRRPVGTIFELIIPPLAVVVLIGLRFGVFEPEDRCFTTFPTDPLTVPLPSNSYQIFYTPNTTQTERIEQCISASLPYVSLTGVATETELLARLTETEIESPLNFTTPGTGRDIEAGCFLGGAGIVFDNLDKADGPLEYTLRLRHEVGEDDSWETRDAAPNFQAIGPRVANNFYLSEGFLHLQNVVGEAIIRIMADPNGTDCDVVLQEEFTVAVRQLPYPGYTIDIFLIIVVTILPFFVVLAYIYSAGIFTKELVLEKETRIRESMLMMGLQQWVLWSTWFLKQFLLFFITALLITILLKFGQVFPESDFFLLLLFFLAFLTSAISFCFFLSVWFNTARVGLLVGFLGWFLNYIPYFFIPGNYDTFSLGGKVAFCLLSNTCMGLGINTIALLEIRGEGVKWDNFTNDISLDDDFHLGYVFLMLIIDSILYMTIAWYVNGVKPGQYGVPKPFYFPFLPSYWLGRPLTSKMKEARQLAGGSQPDYDPSAHEEEPKDLPAGISIQNLTKVYDENILVKLLASHTEREKRRKVAVNELNLNMYEGQITALLGHNGAGKTTTMSILTGLYTPTSGTAVINGHDIRTNMDQIRHSLGICPQHNVLFDRLTVREHLTLFGRLKGLGRKEVKEEADTMIEDLQLQDKRDVPSSNLSGGMKRKLSVGIALIGGSKIVVLDEPTSGIDAYARRAIWDLLSKHKKGRTMLLTTHFMDEADLLGDRIAIMAEGKLRCSGSSLFLKSRYGVGYHMVVVKEPTCNSDTVTSLVHSMVEGSKKITDVGTELSYVLPSNATQSFPQLFDSLEARKSELGISGFGISITTMEEVFIKVGEGTDETLEKRLERTGTLTNLPPQPTTPHLHEEEEEQQQEVSAATEGVTVVDIEVSGGDRKSPDDNGTLKPLTTPPKDFDPNTGIFLWIQQFRAMFMKKVYNSIRFWQAVISQLILPLMFVLFGLILAVTLPNANENDPKRALTVESSGLDVSNRFFFFAEFDGATDKYFEGIEAREFGATNFESFTDETIAIQNASSQGVPSDGCCSYSYQILDKACAAQNISDLQSCGSGFGYSNCNGRDGTNNCLQCCRATWSLPATCTNPVSQLLNPSRDNLCPAPPRLSFDDIAAGNPSGRLDSNMVYMDEHLLRRADNLDAEVFIRRYLGGFVMSHKEPIYDTCARDKSTASSIQATVAATFSECTEIRGNDLYTLTQSDFPWLTNPELCPALNESESGNVTTTTGLDGNSLVDGLSEDLAKLFVCPNDTSSNLLPLFTPNFATPRRLSATVYYNNNPWHMSAASLNAFHNIWLRKAVTGGDDLSLIVNNHPLPRNAEAEVLATAQNFNGYSIGSMVVFGFSFLLASFVLFIVNEKETKAKHLQYVSGVDVTSYWLSAFVWDLINSMIPVFFSFLLFAAFQVEGFTGDALGAILLLLFFTCWSTIPIVYTVSFLFSNSLVAFGLIVIFLFLSSQIFLVITLVITDVEVVDGLHYFFLLDPAYNLAAALNDLYTNNIVREACTASPENLQACQRNEQLRFQDDIFATDRPGIGVNFIYFFFEGIFFFILTLLIEYQFFIPEIRGLFLRNGGGLDTTFSETPLEGEDEDVIAERKKIATGGTDNDDVIVIKDLVKVYGRRLDGCTLRPSKLAVQGINLSIPSSECFGLLGVNGAGKTTTFSMLTGDINPSKGTAIISGYDIRTDLRKVQQRIGYCPQFDALIERMTGRELLWMFARLRGIPESLIEQAVEAEVNRLDLAKHASKQCGKYSGGNKRKLSTALALVGNPPIVFLDEPTTGMDPATRRYLWDVLISVTKEGRSIILTSHSMEECEALCTRLAIMVNGRFKCLGGIQHLKGKYGSGFYLQARVKLSDPPPEQELTQHRSRSSLRRSLRRQTSREQSQPPLSPTQTTSHAQFESTTERSITSLRSPTSPVEGHDFGFFTTQPINIFIKETFQGAVKLEEHQGSVTYQLPSQGLTWSTVFRRMEENKERLGIVDYSVSQTTLEQVFIDFAKEQHEEGQ